MERTYIKSISYVINLKIKQGYLHFSGLDIIFLNMTSTNFHIAKKHIRISAF